MLAYGFQNWSGEYSEEQLLSHVLSGTDRITREEKFHRFGSFDPNLSISPRIKMGRAGEKQIRNFEIETSMDQRNFGSCL